MEKDIKHMTECEKLDAGMAYDFWDKGVNDRKLKPSPKRKKLNAIDPGDEEAIEACLRRLFGSCGSHPWTGPGFRCDNGSNIHVGDNFLANFNVTILDIGPVHIGDHVMIGPGTLITTVNHPCRLGDGGSTWHHEARHHRKRRLGWRQCHHPARRHYRQ